MSYESDDSIENKIRNIVVKVYGGKDITADIMKIVKASIFIRHFSATPIKGVPLQVRSGFHGAEWREI